jgi:Tfp pilus assembly protein PilO
MTTKSSWHVDKKLNISVLIGIALQTMAFIWWAASYTAANDAMNLRQNDDIRELKSNVAVISDMKADVAVIKASMADIKAKLDK